MGLIATKFCLLLRRLPAGFSRRPCQTPALAGGTGSRAHRAADHNVLSPKGSGATALGNAQGRR
jgi:hypothetical protein